MHTHEDPERNLLSLGLLSELLWARISFSLARERERERKREIGRGREKEKCL